MLISSRPVAVGMVIYDRNVHSSSPQDKSGEINMLLSSVGTTFFEMEKMRANNCASFYMCINEF